MNTLFQPPLTPSTCSGCASLRQEKKKLQRQLRGLESKLETNQTKWEETFERLSKNKTDLVSTGLCFNLQCSEATINNLPRS